MRVVIGITGASGSIYAVSVIKSLIDMGVEVHGVISEMGERVLMHECSMKKEEISEGVIWHQNDNLFAAIASGSYKIDAMAVVPCSMNTLAKIATGGGDGLLLRAASVCIKERRRLVIVPREMPLSIIYIERMLEAAKAGAVILPACPGFYHDPRTMGDLINHVAGKILDLLNVENNMFRRWGDE